jgi:hypothetical protein
MAEERDRPESDDEEGFCNLGADPLGLPLPLPGDTSEDGEPARCLRLSNGNLRIVLEPTDPELASGWLEIGPEHPGYSAWLPHAEEGLDES